MMSGQGWKKRPSSGMFKRLYRQIKIDRYIINAGQLVRQIVISRQGWKKRPSLDMSKRLYRQIDRYVKDAGQLDRLYSGHEWTGLEKLALIWHV